MQRAVIAWTSLALCMVMADCAEYEFPLVFFIFSAVLVLLHENLNFPMEEMAVIPLYWCDQSFYTMFSVYI